MGPPCGEEPSREALALDHTYRFDPGFSQVLVESWGKVAEFVAWDPRVEVMFEVEGKATSNPGDEPAAEGDRAVEDVVARIAVDELDPNIWKGPTAENDQGDVGAKRGVPPPEHEGSNYHRLRPEGLYDNPRSAVRSVLEDPAREVVLVEGALTKCSEIAELVDIAFRVHACVELSVVDLMGLSKSVAALESESAGCAEHEAMNSVGDAEALVDQVMDRCARAEVDVWREHDGRWPPPGREQDEVGNDQEEGSADHDGSGKGSRSE